ncbi:hypothetical protein JCM11491_006830, partial [Sporobolomyces phaffii]
MLFSKLLLSASLLVPAALALVVPEGSPALEQRDATLASPASTSTSPDSVEPNYPGWRRRCRYRPWRCYGGGYGGGGWGGGGWRPRDGKREEGAENSLSKRFFFDDFDDFDFDFWKRSSSSPAESDDSS